MYRLKYLLFVVCFLFENIEAGKNKGIEDDVAFCVNKNEEKYCTYRQQDNADDVAFHRWKDPVQQFYDGCVSAVRKFSGPSFELADTAMKSLTKYLEKLKYFTKSNSKMLRTSSEEILIALGKLNKLDTSAAVIIREFTKVWLSDIVNIYMGIISQLSKYIGHKLTDFLNEALYDYASTIDFFVREFLRCEIVGYETVVKYEPIVEKFQVFLNAVSSIVENYQNYCRVDECDDVSKAVTVLNLILIHLAIVTQGINSCTQSVLNEQNCDIPAPNEACSVPLGYFLVEFTDSVCSVVYPFDKSLKAQLTKLVELKVFLNSALKDSNVCKPFEGVAITDAQIVNSLSKSCWCKAAAKAKAKRIQES